MAGDALDRPEVDALYDLDPSEFVAARDALAKEVKAAGDADAAREVKALKKPTKAAWAINQVARAHADDVAALRDAGAAVRASQADALSGGDAGALRAAAADRRDAVRALVALVVDLAGDAVRDDATGTFEAASVDDVIGEIVAAGRLATVVARPSDMGFGGMPDPPARTAPRATSKAGRTARGSKAGDEPEAPIRIDRKRVQKLERQVDAAQREADSADDAMADAERRLARAEDAVAAAEAKRADAATALDAARARREDAARSLADARADLDRLSDGG